MVLSSVIFGRDLQAIHIEISLGEIYDLKRQLLLVPLGICPLETISRPQYFACPTMRTVAWQFASRKVNMCLLESSPILRFRATNRTLENRYWCEWAPARESGTFSTGTTLPSTVFGPTTRVSPASTTAPIVRDNYLLDSAMPWNWTADCILPTIGGLSSSARYRQTDRFPGNAAAARPRR